MYEFSGGHIFSFNLSKYLELEWLSHLAHRCLTVLGKLYGDFPKWLYHFTFPSAVEHMDSSSSMFLPTIGIVNLLNFIHSSKCVVVTTNFLANPMQLFQYSLLKRFFFFH